MSAPVDVLAVMDAEIHSLPEMASAIRFAGAKYGWGIDESEAVRRMEEARAAVAELIEADAAFDAAMSEVATYEAVTPDRSRNYRTLCYVQFREALDRRKAALAHIRGAA